MGKCSLESADEDEVVLASMDYCFEVFLRLYRDLPECDKLFLSLSVVTRSFPFLFGYRWSPGPH